MYIPPANHIEDRQKAFDLIESHGFATVVTQSEGAPWASHLPVLLDAQEGPLGTLRSHMARANEQWRHFDPAKEVLCLFHGPHAYISPSWYVSKIAVPTWNYATVHVYGYPTLVEDPAGLRRILDDTTEKYEKQMAQPWKMELPEQTVEGLMKAIVGFSLTISRIETKFKLGQNRSQEDRESMLRALQSSPNADARELAAFIQKENCQPHPG